MGTENSTEARFDELGLDPKVLTALKDVGYEDARASLQADMDAWAKARGLN